jgi:misacylated tRNA(Ala) deacylase
MVELMMGRPQNWHLTVCFDYTPCGTHIRNTAEIGPVAITKIENKGRQNRRINIAFAE